MERSPAGIFCGARKIFIPAAQPITTGTDPAGNRRPPNAGRCWILNGNAGIAKFLNFTPVPETVGTLLSQHELGD